LGVIVEFDFRNILDEGGVRMDAIRKIGAERCLISEFWTHKSPRVYAGLEGVGEFVEAMHARGFTDRELDNHAQGESGTTSWTIEAVSRPQDEFYRRIIELLRTQGVSLQVRLSIVGKTQSGQIRCFHLSSCWSVKPERIQLRRLRCYVLMISKSKSSSLEFGGKMNFLLIRTG
jgi:hypothetical protein